MGIGISMNNKKLIMHIDKLLTDFSKLTRRLNESKQSLCEHEKSYLLSNAYRDWVGDKRKNYCPTCDKVWKDGS